VWLFHSRLAHAPGHLLRHHSRIVLQKRNLIQGNVQERVVQFAFESLLSGA
jgi:hypothetical protein